MNGSLEHGPHHSDDTRADKTILVEFVAEMIPHDSPEFQERARLAALRPIPDYLKDFKPGRGKPHSNLVQFTAELIPGDSPETLARERKGRPARSPSLPPDEPTSDEPPVAT